MSERNALRTHICDLLNAKGESAVKIDRLIYMWDKEVETVRVDHADGRVTYGFAKDVDSQAWWRTKFYYGVKYLSSWDETVVMVARHWPDEEWLVENMGRQSTFVARRKKEMYVSYIGKTAQLALLRLFFNTYANRAGQADA